MPMEGMSPPADPLSRAFDEARAAALRGEAPIGAVVTRAGEVIAGEARAGEAAPAAMKPKAPRRVSFMVLPLP